MIQLGYICLANAVSEAVREMHGSCSKPRILVSLDPSSGHGLLILDFAGEGERPRRVNLDAFFDKLCTSEAADGFSAVRAFKRLPRAGFEATDFFVEEQRAQIQAKSREDLMDEIQRQNAELEEHSAQLEYTVAQRSNR